MYNISNQKMMMLSPRPIWQQKTFRAERKWHVTWPSAMASHARSGLTRSQRSRHYKRYGIDIRLLPGLCDCQQSLECTCSTVHGDTAGCSYPCTWRPHTGSSSSSPFRSPSDRPPDGTGRHKRSISGWLLLESKTENRL